MLKSTLAAVAAVFAISAFSPAMAAKGDPHVLLTTSAGNIELELNSQKAPISVDNFLKPFLISRTASLPILLIALGAFGGVLAFGFIGLFLGPTFLALGQALFAAWTAITPAAHEADSTEGLA